MSLNLELKRAREAKNAAKKGQGPPKEVVVTIFKSIQEETAWRIEQMMAHPVKPPSPSPSPSPPLWLALHAGLPIRWSCVLPLCAPCLVYRAARLQIGRTLGVVFLVFWLLYPLWSARLGARSRKCVYDHVYDHIQPILPAI